MTPRAEGGKDADSIKAFACFPRQVAIPPCPVIYTPSAGVTLSVIICTGPVHKFPSGSFASNRRLPLLLLKLEKYFIENGFKKDENSAQNVVLLLF